MSLNAVQVNSEDAALLPSDATFFEKYFFPDNSILFGIQKSRDRPKLHGDRYLWLSLA